jgi:RecB family exonuclease
MNMQENLIAAYSYSKREAFRNCPESYTLGEGDHYIQGVIDRMVQKNDDVYEIHDYKTSNFLSTQGQVDADKQLALYQVALRQMWPDVKEVTLVWHYHRLYQVALRQMWPDVKEVTLVWHYHRHGKELRSTRSDEDLEKQRFETIFLIARIESTGIFLPEESDLCDWCDYQPLCSTKKHVLEVAGLPRITDHEGVRLTN